ncbi:hypothetical protein D9Q98_006552 [Chlorella vulgaris]|uniref:Uncharacterized protein n=1 Tax=Chlorella vulgaris TaxID=3077 RepID=A0A9D4YV68_CHLVU|nr:hypothetical protein D9Q98_006552 [Chlorella vulgaris]
MALLWRQELFAGGKPQHLKECLVPLLLAHRTEVAGVNLPNKATDLDICVHYSVNANYNHTPEASFTILTNFCLELAELRCSLLLVSGGGPRKRLNSLAALERIESSPAWSRLQLPLAVAYNPYFPDAARRQEEEGRLRAKLVNGGGRIQAVYLQAGSDVPRLQQGLKVLQDLLEELGMSGGQQEGQQDGQQQPGAGDAPAQQRSGGQPSPAARPAKRQRQQSQQQQAPQRQPVRVYGSVLVPSKKQLAAMKFRPWGGVFLSDEYLSSVEAADAITRRLVGVYADQGVLPLVETAVEGEADVTRVRQLLQVAST